MYSIIPLLIGWGLDRCAGDPAGLPHPVVAFGRWIGFFEKKANCGTHRREKGTFWAVTTLCSVFLLSHLALAALSIACGLWEAGGTYLYYIVTGILIFYCLAGTTLIREVRMVFLAADRSIEEGRKQVSRIVGRDTSRLSDREVRTAALETLAENLSDGVIAPLFWLYLLGLPGMLTYKMVNTMDSMLGYRTERFLDFGRTAARIDDAANYLPARLTALLMALSSCLPPCRRQSARTLRNELLFIRDFGRKHASPNSGYPEAALAGILDCRFGGPHHYFGEYCFKPYIGKNERALTTADMRLAVTINRYAEAMMILGGIILYIL